MSKQDPLEHLLPASDAPAPEQGIDLLAVLVAIISEWRTALITFVSITVLCLFYIESLKPQFVARATFLPQEGRSEGGSLASLFSNRGPGALYIGLLQSQTVENDVIKTEHLMERFHSPTLEGARDRLSGISSFSEGPDGIVAISVRDGDAQDAAEIANSFLDALQHVNDSMGKQQSEQTSAFFKGQLDDEQRQLLAAEVALTNTQKQTGQISDAQTSTTLTAIQATRDQIAGLEAQRSVLLLSETDENPQVQRLTQNIAILRSKEAQYEGSGGSNLGAATPAGRAPDVNLEILRAQRLVKYHEVLVNSLATQSESAHLSQEAGRSAFQVVDKAVPPEHKAWPPRKPFFAFALGFAAFMGMVAVTLKLLAGRLLRDPEHRDQLRQIRKAFGGR